MEIITKVTRSVNGSVSLIDHIITNSNKSSYISGVFQNTISDHFPTFHILSDDKKSPLPKYISKRDFSEENIKKFGNNLSNLTWDNVLKETDTQQSFNEFWSIFKPLFDIQFPIKVMRFNKNIHKIDPWTTQGILVSRRHKYNLRDNYLKSPTHLNKKLFVDFKNMYNKVVRESKKSYYEMQFDENKNNIKKLGPFSERSQKSPRTSLV